MSTPNALHTSLLRPAILNVLRASGFHSSRPSVIDTLTDLAARYLLLIASRTAEHTYDRTLASATDDEPENQSEVDLTHDDMTPTITDVRLGLTDAAFFTPTMTSSEEAWAETLRKPLSAYPEGARNKERRRRDAEDTRDIRDFIDWATGPAAREIRRIAGQLHEDASGPAPGGPAPAVPASAEKDDYVVALKKKHGGKEPGARYAGTLLGEGAGDVRGLKIEGGPASLGEWMQGIKRKREDAAT